MSSERPVWVLDVALPDDAITDRPTHTLDEQCLQAASRLVARRPDLPLFIDGIYFGTMGMFAGQTEGRRVPAHIPGFLRDELGLEGLVGGAYNSYASTSESGAVALLRACRAVREGRVETALVVGGEQMFSTDPGYRKVDRDAIRAWIRGVVDPSESAVYGLSMLEMGDLVMDHIAFCSGMPPDLWRQVLETVTLDKYERAGRYPWSMQPAKEARQGSVVDLLAYRDPTRNPWVTPHFRRDDVCASANGATALVLTSREALTDTRGPRVRVAGMGEGHTTVAFSGRPGPVSRFAAIRRSLRHLCHSARVHPSLLRGGAGTGAILHDAFPSIEVAFLSELAPDAPWSQLLGQLLSGTTHPLGGLCAGGHALGNSGLFQVAKAAHMLTADARYLSPAEGSDPSCMLLTNVGSALTNVVATLLFDDRGDTGALDAAQRAYAEDTVDAALAAPRSDPLFGPAIDGLGDTDGIVAARTRSHTRGGEPGWAYLLHTREGTRFALGTAGEPHPIGSRLGLREEDGRLLVDSAHEQRVSAPTMADADQEAVRAAIAEVRKGAR